MTDWNAELYLRFKEQRTQPARDLAVRLQGVTPARAADIGCGPGNSTAVLQAAFPEAYIRGVDTSVAMLEKARSAHPELEFALCDARELESGWDLLFSNACLQWIPDHETLLPGLMDKLNPGGTLAVQMPVNGEEPLFRIIREVTAEPEWGFAATVLEHNDVRALEDYHAILSGCAADYDIWETVYHHRMPSHEAMLEWVKSTRLRPYLTALDEMGQTAFLAELLHRVKAVYTPLTDGQVLLRFRRLFFTARKS
ncbi:MAG: methyltransferase domain-containing protein [Clostridia bacterium]|nr:methyltransferase domain-containing protein [Clostridia bacterium]